MPHTAFNRRTLIASGSAALLSGGLTVPARAQSQFAPTQTMRGGSNNYRPGAPIVDKLGDGFIMSGRVLQAGTGRPIQGARIQIWAATVLGGERHPPNHGSVLSDATGTYRLEMPQVVPNFGQPHAHLAYDDDAFETVFLRPVMPSASDTSLQADFILAPA